MVVLRSCSGPTLSNREYSAHGLDQVAGTIPATVRSRPRLTPAQLAMGDSWRIGVDEQENTTLVRTACLNGCHPIYTAMMAFGLGC